MENLERILGEHPFLRGMSEAQMSLMVGCAKNVVFKAGEYILHEGEPANQFFFVRQGLVHIETHVPNKGTIIIRSRGEGEVLGWSWLVPPFRWHFDAKAVELTRVIALDGKCLREKCDVDHNLGYELMKRFAIVIAERLEATRLQLMDIYGNGPKK
jgi:CRP-like cAMP-binding protein